MIYKKMKSLKCHFFNSKFIHVVFNNLLSGSDQTYGEDKWKQLKNGSDMFHVYLQQNILCSIPCLCFHLTESSNKFQLT